MRRLSLLAVSIMAASGATAGTLNVNDTRLNAMGGAGASSSDRLNPALISPARAGNAFEINLASATLYTEDPQGFANKLQAFLDDDLETYEEFDYGQISQSLDRLTNALSATVDATNDYAQAVDDYIDEFENDPDTADSEPVNTAFNDLDEASNEQTAAISGMFDSTNSYDTLARDTQDTFNELSNRAVNVGLMASLGLRIPRGGAPFALSLSNNTYGGAELLLQEDDLDGLRLAIDDIEEYNTELEGIDQTEFANLMSAARELDEEIAKGDQADSDDIQDLLEALDTALTAFQGAQTDLEGFNSAEGTDREGEGLFVNGEFNEDAEALNFDPDNFDSTIEILGANITELALGTGYDFPNDLGNFSVGAVGKFQYVQVFSTSFGVDDADDFDVETLQDDLEGYITGNIDLGISQTFPNVTVGTFAVGAVVKDLIPQTFEAPNGRDVSIGPKVRAGVSHQTPLTLIAVDLDLTENEPVGYGSPSRYLGLGMEFDAWGWANIRGGYRNNLAVDDASIITAGVGITPWIMSVEVSGWTKPNAENDIDLALNSGLSADISFKF